MVISLCVAYANTFLTASNSLAMIRQRCRIELQPTLLRQVKKLQSSRWV